MITSVQEIHAIHDFVKAKNSISEELFYTEWEVLLEQFEWL
jgi:hypothetical protein